MTATSLLLFLTFADPAGYWPESRTAPILAKIETIRLAPDLSRLTPGEQAALRDLYEVGRIFQDIYEESRHHQALAARRGLEALGRKDLLALYRLWQGPIVTTLENAREPFVPADPQVPARNVYPIDATRAEIDAFLAAHPSTRPEILGERTVVRRATAENLGRDLRVLTTHPAIDVLHPALQARLKSLAAKPDRATLYAVPYPVAYADQLMKAYGLLRSAADHVEATDGELAGYLRNRARDLLTNDYESGDASWVTASFEHLNAQIGSYETYDDALFGVKAFHSVSLMIEDEAATAQLRRELGGLQAIEDALPYSPRKRVRDDIPVGVYDIIADFGQARGTNTATILPNDALYSRRYGRRIMMRKNILTHPDIFASNLRVWRAATADAHADDLAPEGNFQRTLWHEIGHYVGPDRDKAGRALDVALEDYADSIEEMKSDLVSLFSLHRMRAGQPGLRPVQASGILRTLQNVQPRRDQPYQTMQLIQFNWFVENGLLVPDPDTARLTIRYDRYAGIVTSLLREVLALQANGDKAAAAQFFDRWTKWTPELHDRLAARIREAQGARWRIVRYRALND
ncbi:MAG TPA: NUDIX hydrolase [Thermoanaerobaculia bacterium]|nr:NUDIX hydrolase [Thermoanaerobaculia bacterium]